MLEQDSIPATVHASSMVRDAADRQQVKALAAAAALTIPGVCSHCGRTNKQVVHAFGHQWFGENWDLARLLDAIDSADHIRWIDNADGHDLVVLIDGERYRFQVKRPAQAASAA